MNKVLQFPIVRIIVAILFIGFGWEFLYVYFVAWIVALVISYKSIFAKSAV